MSQSTEAARCVHKAFEDADGICRYDAWFSNDALQYEEAIRQSGDTEFNDLHVGAGWEYLSRAQYEEMMSSGWRALPNEYQPASGHSVFELGMGTGAALRMLSQRGCAVSGSDYCEEAVSLAKRALPEFAVNFAVHDMTKPHEWIGSNSYDFVVSFGALGMYLQTEQMEAAIIEASRITKPGGWMIFTHFIEPGCEPRLSIACPVSKHHWQVSQERLNIMNVSFPSLPHQGQRYTMLAQSRGLQEDEKLDATGYCASAMPTLLTGSSEAMDIVCAEDRDPKLLRE